MEQKLGRTLKLMLELIERSVEARLRGDFLHFGFDALNLLLPELMNLLRRHAGGGIVADGCGVVIFAVWQIGSRRALTGFGRIGVVLPSYELPPRAPPTIDIRGLSLGSQ